MLYRKRKQAVAVIVSAVVASVCAAYLVGALDTFEEGITDRLFLRREPPSSIVIIAIDDESIGRIGQWPWPRAAFASVLAMLSEARAVGVDVSFSEPSRFGAADDAALAEALRVLQVLEARVVLPVRLDERGRTLATPLPLLSATTVQGVATIPLDADGIARRTPFIFERRAGGGAASVPIDPLPSFGAGVAEVAGSTLNPSLRSAQRIPYAGPAGNFLTLSFADVLESRIPASVFADKIVFIGATAPDLHDTVMTPFGIMAGVEAHANIAAAIAEERFFTETPSAIGILLIALVALLTAAGILLTHRFRSAVILLAILGGGIIVASAILFGLRIVIPHAYLLLSFIGAAGVLYVFQYIAELREKRFIRESFQQYVMPEVVEELMLHPEKLQLGGEKRLVTIFFSDIRGFTTLSEGLTPEALVELMNEYLSAMTECIMHTRGVVDKYIGDAIMAFWGAPLSNDQQVEDAARAARAMQEELRAFNGKREKQHLPLIAIGMGISTGEVIVGNMGSTKRFNYTLMGDEVNFASRLEGLTKTYGVACITGERTATRLGAAGFTVRELDLVMVKGKKEPRRIFELVLDPDASGKAVARERYAVGLERYREGKWQEAIEAFEAGAIEGDKPSALFLERCRELAKNPPAKWEGVYEFTTK